jgi:hypothetical protein
VICITTTGDPPHVSRKRHAAKVSASMAEWPARLVNDRRLNMSVQETNEIRELTAVELDVASGGKRMMYDNTEPPLEGHSGSNLGETIAGGLVVSGLMLLGLVASGGVP